MPFDPWWMLSANALARFEFDRPPEADLLHISGLDDATGLLLLLGPMHGPGIPDAPLADWLERWLWHAVQGVRYPDRWEEHHAAAMAAVDEADLGPEYAELLDDLRAVFPVPLSLADAEE